MTNQIIRHNGRDLIVHRPHGPDFGILIDAITKRFVCGWSIDPKRGAYVRSFRTHIEARGKSLREALEQMLALEEAGEER